MIIEPVKPGDLQRIKAQKWQVDEVMWGGDFEPKGVAFSAWEGETCLGVGGIEPKWLGSAVVWALFAEGWQTHALPMTRFCRYLIDNEPTPRIEAYVKSDNTKARRWALALGLKCEARRLERFGPGGIEMDLFVRIK